MSFFDVQDVVDDVIGADFNIVAHLHRRLQLHTMIPELTMLCIVVHALNILNIYSTSRNSRDCIPYKDQHRKKLISYLVHTNRCRDIIQMGPEAFNNLCHRLRASGLVKDAIRCILEEQVAKFLHIIGHNVKNHSVGFFFYRFGSTISRHFHNVLDAILSLELEFLIQPPRTEVKNHVLNDSRFYPYFKVTLAIIIFCCYRYL